MSKTRYLLLPLIMSAFLFVGRAPADESVAYTKVPTTINEFKDLQKIVQDVNKKVMAAVVGVRVGDAAGSGVIVNDEGIILTAGHVSGKPNTEVTVIFPDGKKAKGKTLGANRGIDSGMIQITDKGTWPHVEVGESKNLKKGQWVIALGHPGGYVEGRKPVLRLGRILSVDDRTIQTDCTLVGGDSGGPLFDLDGKVIGIHSRIGAYTTFNIHVPVDTFTETWDDLVASKEWGNSFGIGGGSPRRAAVPSLPGLSYEKAGDLMKVIGIEKDSDAEKAGFKVRDLIEKVDGKTVTSFDDMNKVLEKRKEGDEVTVDFLRSGSPMSLKLKLVKAKK